MQSDDSSYSRIIVVVCLLMQSVSLVGLMFVGWHFKDNNLYYLIYAQIVCAVILNFFLKKMKFTIVLIFGVIAMSTFSYNPYTYKIIADIKTMNVYKDVLKGEIYLIDFEDGSSATVSNNNSNWKCYGKEFSNKSACAHMVSIIKDSRTYAVD